MTRAKDLIAHSLDVCDPIHPNTFGKKKHFFFFYFLLMILEEKHEYIFSRKNLKYLKILRNLKHLYKRKVTII